MAVAQMKEYWVWSFADKRKYKIKGRSVKIIDWLDTFIQKKLEIQIGLCGEAEVKKLAPNDLWNVSELQTGAIIANGKTQKEAIAVAKWELEKRGRLSVIRQRNKYAKIYGILNEGSKQMTLLEMIDSTIDKFTKLKKGNVDTTNDYIKILKAWKKELEK